MTPEALLGERPAGPLARRFREVRAQSLALAAPLGEADCQAQSMPDASPVKWHLAHVTWFFETFVLERFEPRYQPHHPAYRVLFNSYYQGVGERHPRPQRGLVTRPSLAEVLQWLAQPGGLGEIGHDGAGFAFDNESPRHTVFLQAHALANRPRPTANGPSSWPTAATPTRAGGWRRAGTGCRPRASRRRCKDAPWS